MLSPAGGKNNAASQRNFHRLCVERATFCIQPQQVVWKPDHGPFQPRKAHALDSWIYRKGVLKKNPRAIVAKRDLPPGSRFASRCRQRPQKQKQHEPQTLKPLPQLFHRFPFFPCWLNPFRNGDQVFRQILSRNANDSAELVKRFTSVFCPRRGEQSLWRPLRTARFMPR